VTRLSPPSMPSETVVTLGRRVEGYGRHPTLCGVWPFPSRRRMPLVGIGEDRCHRRVGRRHCVVSELQFRHAPRFLLTLCVMPYATITQVARLHEASVEALCPHAPAIVAYGITQRVRRKRGA
jgi:hypothetical protein